MSEELVLHKTNRVIICGSRTWTDREAIADHLHNLTLAYPPGTWITVVHGDAKGADRIAHQEAQKHGMLVEAHPYQSFISVDGCYACAHPADIYASHEHEYVSAKRAPLVRNRHMASLGADLCIAFWKDGSTGTAHMLEQAKRFGIPTEIVRP